ncbi:hypothetical protein GEMRC1_012786 [Eukaryota sp. GEM-RC1]
MYGEQSIQFVDYNTEAVRFLGSYFGNPLQIESVLKNYLQKIKVQLQTIQDLKIDNHLAFSVLSVCFGSKINHLLRSLPPELSLGFAREFNSLRTQFLGNLVEINSSKIPYHAFSVQNLVVLVFKS